MPNVFLFILLFNGTGTNSPMSMQVIPQDSLATCQANAAYLASKVPRGMFQRFSCIETRR